LVFDFTCDLSGDLSGDLRGDLRGDCRFDEEGPIVSESQPLQERLPMDSQPDPRGIAIKPLGFFLLGQLREDLTPGIIRWKEVFPRARVGMRLSTCDPLTGASILKRRQHETQRKFVSAPLLRRLATVRAI